MNAALYMPLIICALASMLKSGSRVYFLGYGMLMVAHYCAASGLSATNYDLYYLSDAALCAFLVLCLPKNKEYIFLSIVCCACVITNILGYALWDNSSSIAIYDDLYFGIYAVTILYLIPKAYHDRINKALGIARNFFRSIAYSYHRYLGAGK